MAVIGARSPADCAADNASGTPASIIGTPSKSTASELFVPGPPAGRCTPSTVLDGRPPCSTATDIRVFYSTGKLVSPRERASFLRRHSGTLAQVSALLLGVSAE